MDKINWTSELSVGVQELDDQHKKIIDEINKLIEIQNNPQTEYEIVPIIKNITAYARQHLSHEEELLVDNDYPDYEKHYEKHNFYRDGFYSLLGERKKPLSEVIDFLLNWWKYHILNEDMNYKAFLKAKGIK